MSHPFIRYTVALLFLPLTFSGCFLFESSKAQSEKPPVEVESEVVPQSVRPDPGPTGIEVTWQVPAEKVDGFVVRYGYSKDDLTAEKKVAVASLTSERDQYYGPVYRYILTDIAPKKLLFVSIAAFKGEKLSEFSPVMEEKSITN